MAFKTRRNRIIVDEFSPLPGVFTLIAPAFIHPPNLLSTPMHIATRTPVHNAKIPPAQTGIVRRQQLPLHMKQRQHIDALPSVREADGMQALHFAAESASVDCFRVLLGAGANPVATDNCSTRE